MLGDRFKRARRAKGLSTRALAAKVGVSAQAISKYERGLMTPSSSILIKLAKELGVTVEYLVRNLNQELTCEIVHVCLAKYIH